ncbi:Fur family transcriptional regulator [Streptantibioticus cattleyicolor]|uniref:Ferric uptake regulator, Fur family n=1 Tax=Streptantibioticus cattleyicolor (strain ATCC 35852 / DSM 46488 / JCM 4925 / NBRC 14057 / NRRL 8057) TaxID=1003195 RepID=F8JME8_STREN|nr:Fur family transcriptional regulator [Streptantibioticus cattleyicolor]AEW99373.1 ferric uptake regulator, Fur family [Streptantibioticus cattleyicolor NRRL 8057 = DSM 46488]CCB71586.1 putative Fe regulatory protein [Streptantibioticus cattleyicolor NRRL 8057 = DSM 46488]
MTGAHPTDAIAERLRGAGLRATRPRLAVAGALRAMGGHHTADEVHAHLAEHGTELPRTSVYNALVALAGSGIALRADVGPGAAVYEFADTWHHHFVCLRCGQVTDVTCLVGAKPCLTAGQEVGRVDEAQVIFRGVCRDCLAAHGPAGGRTPPSAPAGAPPHEHEEH